MNNLSLFNPALNTNTYTYPSLLPPYPYLQPPNPLSPSPPHMTSDQIMSDQITSDQQPLLPQHLHIPPSIPHGPHSRLTQLPPLLPLFRLASRFRLGTPARGHPSQDLPAIIWGVVDEIDDAS